MEQQADRAAYECPVDPDELQIAAHLRLAFRLTSSLFLLLITSVISIESLRR